MMRRNNTTRILSCLLAAAMIFAFVACGRTDDTRGTQTEERLESSQPVTEEEDSNIDSKPDETTDIASESDDTAQDGSRILIAYFTAAENSGVDAVASASYTTIEGAAVGRIRAVADMIRENTGGELFSIQTSVVYPTDGGDLIDYAAEEQNEDARPELTSRIEDLDQYDTIFIGYPTWWHDMPQVLYSFFDEYDFSGKKLSRLMFTTEVVFPARLTR